MKIAIYGLSVNPEFFGELKHLFDLLKAKQVECFIYEPFLNYLNADCQIFPENIGSFECGDDLPDDVSFLLSLGGDGTILKSFLAVRKRAIPLVGIN